MSNTIVVAIRAHTDNTLMLPPSYSYVCAENGVSGTVVFHYSPMAEMSSEGLTCNYDYLFYDYVDRVHRLDPIFHRVGVEMDNLIISNRLSKPDQLHRARLSCLDIRIPKLYETGNFTKKHYPALAGLISAPVCLVKENNGACGRGQALVPIHQLSCFMQNISSSPSLGKLKEMYPDVVFGSSMYDMGDDSEAFQDRVHVCEYIDNVESEYRVLFFGDLVYVIKRNKVEKEGYFTQANMGYDIIEGPMVDAVTLSDILDKPHIDLIAKLIKVIDLPFGSIDLFIDTDGKLGMFEYSTQFAHYGMNDRKIRDWQTYAMMWVLRHKGAISESELEHVKRELS